VPFKPTQGRPVLCRSCFQKHQGAPQTAAKASAAAVANSVASAEPN
jgi:hypothetical protein